MRVLIATIILLLTVLVGGALLAPQLYHAVGALEALVPGMAELREHPFHRFVHRAMLFILLLGMWPYLRVIGIRTWKEVGLRSDPRGASDLAYGFALGLVSLGCVAALAALAGARELDVDPLWRTLRRLVNNGLAAAIVALIEELFFRGALFGALKKVWSWPAAMAVSSAFYALVHFFERSASPAVVEWSSGFVVLGSMLSGFFRVEALVPGFFSLTLAGAILALLYQRRGTLYCSVGLHAGWIFWLKSYNSLTDPAEGASLWLWGSNRLIDGWIAGGVLLVMGIGACWSKRRSEPVGEAVADESAGLERLG